MGAVAHAVQPAHPQKALILFVRALAKRQARLDAGLPLLIAANDNVPAVKQ
jgi:hypothetical protein